MSKTIVSSLVAALLCVAGTSAYAGDGVPSSTLQKMGLSGMTTMSDSEGMAVRGKAAVAGGLSWATVGAPFGPAGAGSVNFYLAKGKHFAAGSNGSHASASIVQGKIVAFPDGTTAAKFQVRAIKVAAGGFSTAASF